MKKLTTLAIAILGCSIALFIIIKLAWFLAVIFENA
jgi:hypothetical protein